MPCRLVEDRTKALLATHLEDFQELRVHRFAFIVRQCKPRGEQFIRLGALQGREIQISQRILFWK
jgi:hypothetical protein